MDMIAELKDIIRYALQAIAKERQIEPSADVILEIPKDRRLADLSTNIAMQICKSKSGIKPLEIAENIADIIKEEVAKKRLNTAIDKIEAKPPGFINFYFSNRYLQSVVTDICREKENFGKSRAGANKRVLLEFVSANPTGPLSVAHGRQAAVGDVLANILEFAGYKVSREYYLNDEGNQMLLLGKSIHARYCELLGEVQPFPEGGYKGDYIKDIAKALIEKHNKSFIDGDEKTIGLFYNFGIDYIMDMIKKDLSDFGVSFDSYFSQREMTASGKIEKAIARLGEKGLTYEKDGALWFASTSFGDDKDRVLRKSDADRTYTYLAPDIAYHEDKFRRGFHILIDLLGPDHHGYIARLKAASCALAKDDDLLFPMIIQLVTLSRAGVPVKMSTREGEFITLREVMNEVGKDVARFFFLTRRRDSHLDFDLELAKKESVENPVYYIQYAHARICGILDYKKKEGIAKSSQKDLELLHTKEELNLLRILREFPGIVELSALNYQPHRLVQYLIDLASAFHLFYTKHRVVTDDQKLTSARLTLIESLKIVFSKSLLLLGVSCPEKM